MPTFPSNPLNAPSTHKLLRKYPLFFGLPFLVIVVGASYGLKGLTQTRYDLQGQKVSQVTKEEELGLNKRGRKIDIREEYFRLQSAADQDWEPKRIERPKGVPDWGVPPSEPPPRT